MEGGLELQKKMDKQVMPVPAVPGGKVGEKKVGWGGNLGNKVGRPAAASHPKHHLRGVKLWLFAAAMIGLGLGVGVMSLGRVIKIPDAQKPAPTPTATVSAVPTEAIQAGVVQLEKEDLRFDADGDAIPDKLEEMLKYDPKRNDCVRELGCGDFPTLPRARLEINLLFLVDVSGSMTEKLEGTTRWELAKRSLLDLLDSGLPGFANVGVIAFGHKGSADESGRQQSCEGAEVVQQLGPVNVVKTEQVINGLNPRGWTGLANALKLAGTVLNERQGAQNFVIMLSDGKETCGGNPAEVAHGLNTTGVEVITNVIGLAVNEEEKQQLELIARSGGGRYFGAGSRKELSEALVLSAEAVRLWDQVNKCILENLSIYGQCVNLQYLQSINQVESLKLELGEQSGGVAGTGFVERDFQDLIARMWNKFNQLRADNWAKYDEDLKKIYPGRR